MERRLRNSEYTIERIRETFITLMQEQSYESITVTDIAKLVGISRTGFYLFYDNKQDIVIDIANTYIESYIKGCMEGITMSNREHTRDFVRKTFYSTMRDAEMLRTLWNVPLEGVSFYEQMYSHAQDAVLHYVHQHNLSMGYGLPDEVFAEMYTAESMTVLRWWTWNCDSYDVSAICGLAEAVLFQGLFSLLQKN